jgi:23S rRNA (guanosine2251-2'-O)-methyltransferase
MAFTEQDFRNMDNSAKIRKTLYALKEYMRGEGDSRYVIQMLSWLNKYGSTNINPDQGMKNPVIIVNSLLNDLQSDGRYTGKKLFDKSTRFTMPVRILLDNLRSPYNSGSIIRSADAFGLESVQATGTTPLPGENSRVTRTAMGALIPVVYGESSTAVIREHRELGYQVIALEKCSTAVPLHSFRVRFPVLVIAGSEEGGIPEKTLDLCDAAVEIPLPGFKNSLNVSNATAIALYYISEQFRQFQSENESN